MNTWSKRSIIVALGFMVFGVSAGPRAESDSTIYQCAAGYITRYTQLGTSSDKLVQLRIDNTLNDLNAIDFDLSLSASNASSGSDFSYLTSTMELAYVAGFPVRLETAGQCEDGEKMSPSQVNFYACSPDDYSDCIIED